MRCENIDRMASVFADPPVLCGHRGMGVGTVLGHAENTLGSFLAVAELGFRWVEVDVRLTRDDVLVAHHDPVVDGHAVAGLTAEETDARGLLRLETLLETLPPDVAVDLEIKSSLEDALRLRGRTTAALVGRRLAASETGRKLLVTSFDPAALDIVREQLAVPVGLLTWIRFPLRKAIPAAVHLGADVVLPHCSSLGMGPSGEDRAGGRRACRGRARSGPGGRHLGSRSRARGGARRDRGRLPHRRPLGRRHLVPATAPQRGPGLTHVHWRRAGCAHPTAEGASGAAVRCGYGARGCQPPSIEPTRRCRD
jgi:glycerophosphoryl diester phosphodiesterase